MLVRQPLLVVAVEEFRAGLPLNGERKLPAEIVGVLQSGVHALRADRTVDMRGIAQDEGAAIAKTFRGAVVDAIG